MEIKIDTQKDSSEHIKKVIDFLQKFVSETSDSTENTGFTNMFADDSPTMQNNNEENNMFDMFNDNNTSIDEMNQQNDFSLDNELKTEINVEDDEDLDIIEEKNEKIDIIPY